MYLEQHIQCIENLPRETVVQRQTIFFFCMKTNNNTRELWNQKNCIN